MDNKINSRTPEEIKKGLELCIGNSDLSEDYCKKCPYIPDASCRDTLEIDALAYIQRLEHSWDELFETAKQLERERDAAVEVLKQFECNSCIHENVGAGDEPCVNCIHNYAFRLKGSLVDNWQWRGPQEVNENGKESS